MEGLEIAQDMDLPPTAKSAKIPVLKRIKILSMGDAKTGKSCLIKRFCEGQFLTDYIPTIGIDYGVKGFQTRLEEDNKFPLVKVNFWDVGGDDVYVEIRNEFYKDTSGAFLVFDVSNRSSFENLKKWRTEFMEFSSADEKVEFVLIGNKIDSDRIVGKDEGANLAKEWNAKYYETSALTGDNVEEMFVDLFYNSLAAKFEEYTEPLLGKEHAPVATENENDNASIHSEPSARASVASIDDSAHLSASADN